MTTSATLSSAASSGGRTFHYRWQWRLQASPQALWPRVTDTNRFNRDTGVPSVERRGSPMKNARRPLRLFRLGVPVEWVEEPFEWVQPYRFGVVRRYTQGPVRMMRTLTQLEPQPDGGTLATYEVWATPRNLLGVIAIPIQIGMLSARAFGAAFRQYDREALAEQPALTVSGQADFMPGGMQRLALLCEQMTALGGDPVIIERLREHITHGDSLTLARMRPYALADAWGMPRRAVLEHCLLATRRGLLQFEWDVLCPLCRGAKQVAHGLNELHQHVHCDMCNMDFEVNFEQAVELTFHPNPSIRAVQQGEFCIAGPQTTPHIAAQQLIPAGEERDIQPLLEAGRYRLRTLSLRGGEFLRVQDDGLTAATLRASTLDGWPQGELVIHPAAELRLKNSTDDEQLFILERLAWSDQSVTAAEVTALQVFRDLFATEALRPGQQISVGSLTIVFTDLRGSTQLYNTIGDAPAFGLVMTHFDVLREAVMNEGGAIIKTIGDAVMAVFPRPAPALRAMRRAQDELIRMPVQQPIQLKVGLHYGACIAVTLNERLDYFGSTVNRAARLEGFSSGMDVIVSQAVFDDPEVRAMLEQGELQAEAFETQLKGFADQDLLWRVR